LQNLKGRAYLGDHDVDGRIILKLILNEQNIAVKVLTSCGFLWLRIRTNGRVL
jgi:hypothetical protein